MLDAGLDQAHAEGLKDAADICKAVGEGASSASRVAGVLEKSIRNLIQLNKKVALPTGLEPVSSP